MLWLSRALPCHNKREVIGWFTAVRLSIRMTLVCYKTCEPAKRILSLNVREPASSVCLCVCVKYVPFVIYIYIYTYIPFITHVYIYVDIDIAIELYPHMVGSVLSGAIWCYLVLSATAQGFFSQLRRQPEEGTDLFLSGKEEPWRMLKELLLHHQYVLQYVYVYIHISIHVISS